MNDSRFFGIPYLFWAIRRFGISDALCRWWTYELWPRLSGRTLKLRYRQWKRRERRPKSSYATLKIAINRDGDFYLIECPECHRQEVCRNSHKGYFECVSRHCFWVALEDGVVEMRDHRRGEIILPAMASFDPGAKVWRLGLTRKDVPWWWRRRTVYRDLQPDGRDAHGHAPYLNVPGQAPNEEGCICEK